MDRLTAFVAIAHAQLRLDMIKRNPNLLLQGKPDMDIRRPMELAGLKSRLARAKKQDAEIEVTGKRYDTVMDQIDELHAAAKDHVGHREMYAADLKNTVEGMIAGPNGGDPLDDSSNHSEGVPERLTVNGVAS